MSNGYSNPFMLLINQCVPTVLVATLWLLTGCHALPWSPALAGTGVGVVNPAPIMSRFDSPVYIYSPPGLKPELNLRLLPGFPHPGGCSPARTLGAFCPWPPAPARHFAMSMSRFIIIYQNHLHGLGLHSVEFMHGLSTLHQMDGIHLKNNMENYA